jgi:hypothetical protein
MATTAKTGVYWPFKTILQGAGINLTETADTLQIATTGPGPGGGDMLISVYAPNGAPGKVDHAVLADTATNVTHASSADSVPWAGITGPPTIFPTDWSSVQNKPAVFPTTWALVANVPMATVTGAGLLTNLSGSATDVLLGTGVFSPVAPLVAATALLRAGDALTPGAILVGTKDAATSSTSPSTSAAFRAQSQTNGGFGAIGLLCQNFWGCALGAYQSGLYIATSNGSFQQLTNQDGEIIGAALEVGAAVANIGYTPINSAGGAYTLPNQLALIRDYGLGGSSWANAPLRVGSVSSGGRAQIGFHNPALGSAASLYFESDLTFRYIRSDAVSARLHDTLHPIGGADLAIQPVNHAGDTMTGDLTVQKASAQILAYQDGNNYVRSLAGQGLFVMGNYNPQGGQIVIQATGGGSQVAGITFKTQNGYSYSFWAESNGYFYLVRNNDGYAKQLLP